LNIKIASVQLFLFRFLIGQVICLGKPIKSTHKEYQIMLFALLVILVMALISVAFFIASEKVGPYKKSGDVLLALSYGFMVGCLVTVLNAVALHL
jgi:hypothetical protein